MTWDWIVENYWAAFLALAAAGFAIWEGVALAARRTDRTLSYKIREWLGIDPQRPHRVAASVVFVLLLVGFVAWFIPHIVFGWGMG